MFLKQFRQIRHPTRSIAWPEPFILLLWDGTEIRSFD